MYHRENIFEANWKRTRFLPFFSLKSGRIITCTCWMVLPIPDDVIERIKIMGSINLNDMDDKEAALN
jgi:hypothetical protein